MDSRSTRPQAAFRSAGVLLHVTSLPGQYGVGDLGPAAFAFVDGLARAGQTWWQVLPLGPAGAGNSPYQAFSAFAGNPLLISPDELVKDGLLSKAQVSVGTVHAGRVNFKLVTRLKRGLLDGAWDTFQAGGGQPLRAAFRRFCKQQASWLDDFALFMAIRDAHPGVGWVDWPKPLVARRPDALRAARRELAGAVDRHRFAQFLFFRQLAALRKYALGKGVQLIGDLPIYVSPESADVWANPHLFLLDRHRRPTAVAGVPPDYFSETGQRWGNPLYDWPAMKRDGYEWWIARMRAALAQADLLRIDHFRGFAGYWMIPAHLPTAVGGRWVKGPGAELFDVLHEKLGDLPFIAEDLGEITPDVEALRDRLGLPGMRVLQFAFGDDWRNPFLPHQYVRNAVAYTGTHDNDTTAGWYASLSAAEKARVARYISAGASRLSRRRPDVVWAMIRLAWSSVANTSIAPLQDILGLGSAARMNVPGDANGNWGWRFKAEDLTEDLIDRLTEVTETYARKPRRATLPPIG